MDTQKQLQIAEWIRTGTNVAAFIGLVFVIGSVASVEKPAELIADFGIGLIALMGVNSLAKIITERILITPK